MPRPSRRTEALDAAIELIQQHGSAPTMDAIAEAASMTRQALYLHFGSAGELFLAVIGRIGELHDFDERVAHVEAADTPRERLDRYLDLLADYWNVAGLVAVSFENAASSSPEMQAALEMREEGHRAWVSDILAPFEDTLAAGWTLQAASDLLWATADPHHHDLLRRVCGWSRDEYRRALGETVDRVLLDEERRG